MATKGRGAGFDPPNRFEALHYEPDPDAALDPDDEQPAPRTVFLRDPARSIIATNQSPDLGFDASLNPYRGCEHGCAYCLAPQTPVLHADMGWRPLGEIRVGDVLVGFDERPAPGRTRKLRPAVVEAVWWSRKPAWRIVTAHADIVTTAEHRWLRARDFRWSRTERLVPGARLRRVPMSALEPVDDDYRAGYVAGLSLGDGTFRYELGWKSNRLGFPAAYWRVALIDQEPLRRLVDYLDRFGIEASIRPFSGGKSSPRPMWKVEIRSLPKLERVSKLLSVERSSSSFRRGFVAGFYDAEGQNGKSLRISQVDLHTLARVQGYARSFGFEFRLERREPGVSTIRLVGSLAERMRFFATVRPAIRRKLALWGRTPAFAREPVEAIERGERKDVVDIQTSAGTFFAAGLATHNCYARPTHEYLGFSAGLDFETRILVKERAPELLRKELAAPRWKPRVIAISGVTDAYQPIERRLGLTRRCLEVLLEFRNPVAIVTKNRLVARDADLLAGLASFGAASVSVSLTTLDAALARAMEPRASRPELRLEAIARLAEARVPVGVLVAPIVPGLTDHEMPAILEAARGAGASFASFVVLRLPHAVKELFAEWLARHFPERRSKVLNRVCAVRGGRLYDARFATRQRGEGPFAEQITRLFEVSRRRAGLGSSGPPLSSDGFRRPGGPSQQLALL